MNKLDIAIASLMNWALHTPSLSFNVEDVIDAFERLFKCDLTELRQDFTTHSYLSKEEALKDLIDIAFERKYFPVNTTNERDAFEASLYDIFMLSPTEMKKKYEHHQVTQDDLEALYQLSVDVNYIKRKRNSQNIAFSINSTYGRLDITINLAKPEKDPKDIERARDFKVEGRPKCVLCKENEHNYWNARKNLRLIPLRLHDDLWHFQYSPYAYYPYHAILLHDQHIPMVMNQDVLETQCAFVDKVPHMIIGSNAELPIVGGSILNHWHFQAGKHVFPIEYAQTISSYQKEDVFFERLFWPLSTMRLSSNNKNILIKHVVDMYQSWLQYDNQALDIISHTDNNHQTITPIVRKKDDTYIVYIILRNNRTSEQHPYGIFHPNSSLFHIKKENIGLIEAMGLAILPGRLKDELSLIKHILQGETIVNPSLDKHQAWIDALKLKTNVRLEDEVGLKFVEVLEDCGVFKQDVEGQEAFETFFQTLNI